MKSWVLRSEYWTHGVWCLIVEYQPGKSIWFTENGDFSFHATGAHSDEAWVETTEL